MRSAKNQFYEQIRERMIRLRHQARKTQFEWAKFLGVDQPTVSRMERGLRKPTLYEFERAKNARRSS